ncbi:MAG: hypothetical protein ACFFD4_23915 [Candidatus Odinarchaeota archaeon]
MNNTKKTLRKPEFYLFLYFLAFTFYNWPFMTLGTDIDNIHFFVYLFAGWIMIIICIYLLSIPSFDKSETSEKTEKKD